LLLVPTLGRSLPSIPFVLPDNSSVKSSPQSCSVAHSGCLQCNAALFILSQSLGFGPKMTPPPRHNGERIDPACTTCSFCRQGLRPPPLTSARVFVLAFLSCISHLSHQRSVDNMSCALSLASQVASFDFFSLPLVPHSTISVSTLTPYDRPTPFAGTILSKHWPTALQQ